MAAKVTGPTVHTGYVFGGRVVCSGTISCFENEIYVWGWLRAVRPRLTDQHAEHVHRAIARHACSSGEVPAIVDAIDTGGSGEMYAGLNVEEREALAEVTRLGFPPRSGFDVDRVAMGYTGVFAALIDNMVKYDPGYFEDFWSVPGYLGANPPQSLTESRIQHKTSISKVVMTTEAAAMGLPISMSARLGDSQHDLPAALEVKTLPEGRYRVAA